VPSMDGSRAVGNNHYLTQSPRLTACGTPGGPTLYPLTWLGRADGAYGTAASYVLTRKRSASFPAFDALELFVENLESDPMIFAFERQSPVPRALLGRVTQNYPRPGNLRPNGKDLCLWAHPQTSRWVLASKRTIERSRDLVNLL
jgi:hypothetical protein